MTRRRLTALWELGPLPFHVGVQKTPHNPDLPDRLPFTLGRDEDLGILVQMPDDEVEAALDAAYRRGSQIGTPLDDEGPGRPGADEFLDFVREHAEHGSLEDVSVLELGCGNGYLLRRLQQEGADVLGFEPGAASSAAGGDPPIVPEVFDRGKVDRTFDLVVHHGVLEHVRDPVALLEVQAECLSTRGRILCAVPDCAAPIRHGDLSMLVHEHWSYFTEDTLRVTAARAGLAVDSIRSASSAGALYACLEPASRQATLPESGAAADFPERARAGLEKLRRWMSDDAGIYCPGRFLNYLHLLGSPVDRLRFFDDDPALYGRYYPPFDVPVENREDLKERPVARLLIMSRTFGPRLAAELRDLPELRNCEVTTVADRF